MSEWGGEDKTGVTGYKKKIKKRQTVRESTEVHFIKPEWLFNPLVIAGPYLYNSVILKILVPVLIFIRN